VSSESDCWDGMWCWSRIYAEWMTLTVWHHCCPCGSKTKSSQLIQLLLSTTSSLFLVSSAHDLIVKLHNDNKPSLAICLNFTGSECLHMVHTSASNDWLLSVSDSLSYEMAILYLIYKITKHYYFQLLFNLCTLWKLFQVGPAVS